MPVADTFFSHQAEPIKAAYQGLKNKKPNLPKGLSDARKKVFHEVLVALAVNNKNARTHTWLGRVDRLKSKQEDPEVIQLLDIMDYVISNDSTKKKKSELSYYRPLAYILDILFRDCELNIEEELASQATKEARNQNRQLFNDDDEKKALCGRKIDLLVSSMMSINLSSSEWKKATTINGLVQAQQIKNSRTNSNILHSLEKLPISGNDNNKLFTLGMDWIASVGYLFSVVNMEDIQVVFHHDDLFFPEAALSEMADFRQTLDSLYSFQRHLLDLKTMIEAGHYRQRREQKLGSYRTPESTTARPVAQTFFTPTKRK